MTRSRNYIYPIFLLFVLLFTGSRQQAQNHFVPADSSLVKLRTIPAASMEKYRNDSEFDYNRQRPKNMSSWDRFWYSIFDKLGRMGSHKGWEAFLKFLIWGLCIAALVYAVVKFAGMQGIGLFTGNKKADGLDYEVTHDDIYAINFNEAIAKAAEQNNYRLAIRLLYLQTLRRMADRELIHWQPNKTNDSYAQELSGSSYHGDFAWLTYAYDYAWYGDFPVQEEQFRQLQQHFQTFQRQLPA